MKVLIVSVSFFPEVSPRSFRATELAKELRRQGVDVVLAGAEQLEPFGSQRAKLLEHYGIGWISLGYSRWAMAYENWQRGGVIFKLLAKVLGYLVEFPSIEWYFRIPKKLVISTDIDAIVSIAKPYSVHWGVSRWMKKGNFSHVKWLADCGDPFMLSSLNVRAIPFYFSFLEKSFCRVCNFIITPTEEGYKGYYPEFRDKVCVIPQGFHFEEERALLPEYTENEVLTFVYAGAFLHKGRNPASLLTYLKKSSVDFRFYIYTHQKYLVYPHIGYDDSRFIVLDVIPRDEMLGVLRRADFLINMMNGTAVQMPSKLIDYYIVDRPVLNIEKDYLSEQELIILEEFLRKDYRNTYKFENMERFEIGVVAKKFIQLITN